MSQFFCTSRAAAIEVQLLLVAGDCGDYKVQAPISCILLKILLSFYSGIYATFVLRKMIDNACHSQVYCEVADCIYWFTVNVNSATVLSINKSKRSLIGISTGHGALTIKRVSSPSMPFTLLVLQPPSSPGGATSLACCQYLG